MARQLGKKVTLIERTGSLMSSSVPAEISRFYQNYHAEKKVELLLNFSISGIEKESQRFLVSSSDGEEVSGDIVLVGVGVEPNIGLVKNTSLLCENGIIADAYGATNFENIFVAGDCSNFYNTYLKQHVRIESVQHAVDTAKVVAANIMKKQLTYDSVPWFWSDQYNLKLQIAGLLTDYDSSATIGEMSESGFSTFYFKNHKHVATISVNKPSDHIYSRKLLEKGSNLNAEIVAAKKFNIKEFIKS